MHTIGVMKRYLILVTILFSFPSHANGLDDLASFFSDVKIYKAKFSQSVLDEGLNVIQETAGVMWIHRPGKFRWNYEPPYEQVIVGDGDKVWVYDIDLEQITVRKMNAALGNTPAILLAGDGDLKKNFLLEDLGRQGKLNWVKMTPKNKDGGYEDIRIGLEGKDIRTLELIDGLGHTTRIHLSQPEQNPELPEDTFVFVPPAGVDIIDEDGS